MSNAEVKIVVNKDISDEELTQRLEEYTQLKLDGILVCLQCDNIFTRGGAYYCPRCDSDDVVDLWDVNNVTGWGVNSKL